MIKEKHFKVHRKIFSSLDQAAFYAEILTRKNGRRHKIVETYRPVNCVI